MGGKICDIIYPYLFSSWPARLGSSEHSTPALRCDAPGATDSEKQEISVPVICPFQIISDHQPFLGKTQRKGGSVSH